MRERRIAHDTAAHRHAGKGVEPTGMPLPVDEQTAPADTEPAARPAVIEIGTVPFRTHTEMLSEMEADAAADTERHSPHPLHGQRTAGRSSQPDTAAAYPTGMQRHSSRKASESQRTAGRCGNSLPSCQKDRKHE